MSTRIVVLLLLSAVARLMPAEAGMIVELHDPRQLRQQQQVIFPHAEVKVVAFELESIANDPRGKELARALHDRFLKKIYDVQGGAIVTYLTPPNQKIENYRATVERVAKEQKAQIAVWGSVLIDPKGAPRTNVRVLLIEPPAGVSSEYFNVTNVPGRAPIPARGVIDAPVTQTRIDFTTVTGEILPLADFLAGLVRYYKAAAPSGTEATRWLTGSIADFRNYLASSDERSDASAAAQAYLYMARAEVRLAAADQSNGTKWLSQAREHAAKAVELNPFSAEAPTVQAVIAARSGAPVGALRNYVTEAVKAAPLDTTARVNAAMLSNAQGRFPDAMKHLDSARAAYKLNNVRVPSAVDDIKEQAERNSH